MVAPVVAAAVLTAAELAVDCVVEEDVTGVVCVVEEDVIAVVPGLI